MFFRKNGVSTVRYSKGWVEENVHDLGRPIGSCDWCGTAIRYEHLLRHDEKGLKAIAGVKCASYLTGDPEYCIGSEKKARARTRRYQTWMRSSRWKRNRNGNWYRTGVLIFKLPNDGRWRLRIGKRWGELEYERLCDAKKQAFLYLESKK